MDKLLKIHCLRDDVMMPKRAYMNSVGYDLACHAKKTVILKSFGLPIPIPLGKNINEISK